MQTYNIGPWKHQDTAIFWLVSCGWIFFLFDSNQEKLKHMGVFSVGMEACVCRWVYTEKKCTIKLFATIKLVCFHHLVGMNPLNDGRVPLDWQRERGASNDDDWLIEVLNENIRTEF